MTLSRHQASTPVSTGKTGPAGILALVGAALLAAALLGAPSVADASPHDSHRGGVIVTSVGHHRQGDYYRSGHGHSAHRHYYARGESHRRVERARRYASQATAQASTAWRLGCASSSPRWSTDWDDHYFWALDARPRELRRELDRREDQLRECRVVRRHHYRHSSHYRPH